MASLFAIFMSLIVRSVLSRHQIRMSKEKVLQDIHIIIIHFTKISLHPTLHIFPRVFSKYYIVSDLEVRDCNIDSALQVRASVLLLMTVGNFNILVQRYGVLQ